MKKCPACQSQYTDDTLVFCLQDGTRLIDEPITQTRAGGSDLPEDETVIARRRDAELVSQVTQWRGQQEVTIKPAPQKSRSAAPILLLGGGFLIVVLLGAGVIGVWLFSRGAGRVTPNNGNTFVNQRANAFPSPTNAITSPGATPTSNVKPPSNSFSNPPIDDQAAKQTISQSVMTWKSLAEARSLDAYMDRYAETVDYYNHHSVGRGYVRSDKQRAFAMFNSISVTISNMAVTLGNDGQSASAAFDKQWVFLGDHRNEGKVRSQLTFRKVNGEWLITGERDLKVYYTR